ALASSGDLRPPKGGSRSQLRVRTAPRPPAPFGNQQPLQIKFKLLHLTRPCNASRRLACGARTLGWASAASLAGSLSPAIRPWIIARPLRPMTSDRTESSLMLASSSVFCRRWTWLVFSRTSCLRVRSNPRSSWISGPKARPDQPVRQQLGQPCRVVHVSLAAGHVFDMHGLGRHQLEAPSRQHLPDRIPVHPGRFYRHLCAAARFQHSTNSISRTVVVSNVRTTRDTSPPDTIRTHATTVSPAFAR